MILLDIPGFGSVKLKYLVCDYSGTLSVDGKLVEGIAERLNEIAKDLDIFIVTADTHGLADKELFGIDCGLHKIEKESEHLQKEQFIAQLGAENVIAIGNGSNDRKMLKLAKLGIAVCLDEGLSPRALISADIIVNSAHDALDLIRFPKRIIATMRF